MRDFLCSMKLFNLGNPICLQMFKTTDLVAI